MKIRIIATGKIKEAYIKEGVNDYFTRLKKYAPVEIVEVRDEAVLNEGMRALIVEKEGSRLLKLVNDSDFTIALDERGEKFSTVMLSEFIKEKQIGGVKAISFVIGGALGLGENVKKSCRLLLSLSDFTLPHQLARLVLLEQLYRAFTVIKGEPYHK